MKIGFIGILIAVLIGCTFDAGLDDVEPALQEKLPSKTSNSAAVEDTLPQINIRLGMSEKISLNEQSMEISELQEAYNIEHDKLGAETIVHFYVHKSASYGMFTAVHGVVEEYNKKARFKEAKKRFQLHYDKLTQKQQNEINLAHMIRMVEHKVE